jgi:hypothetical protein
MRMHTVEYRENAEIVDTQNLESAVPAVPHGGVVIPVPGTYAVGQPL